jgi:tetrahydromethanopterin S-methyltransferase subunit H
LFIFEKAQKIYDIAGIKIGGNPGENPTVLAGTIFYDGDKLVTDSKSGEFNHKEAEKMINAQDEMSELTGNPCLVQIYSSSDAALREYIDFVTDCTDASFLIDSTQPEVRISGLRYCEEVGLLDRAIYNSLNISTKPEEIRDLKELQHDCAIVLAFNPRDPSIAGRRAVLDDGAGQIETGLLSLCSELGITKPLIDTAITAMGAGAGASAAFTFVVKSVYGYPTGSGVHNAPSSWSWLRDMKKKNRDIFRTCDIASNIIVQSLGADFLLYGPIKNAELVFPAVAMTDVFAAESLSLELGIEPVEGHPFHKLL